MSKTTKRATDRRIPRTQAMLQQALISLIAKQDYEAITITDICDAANVGRSTFYAHYTSKDDLKRSGFDSLRRVLAGRQRAALSATGETQERYLAFSLPMFEHARDHIHLYRALVGSRGGALSLKSIRQMLSELVRSELGASAGKGNEEAIPRELVVQYVVGAYMAVLIWWLDGGAKLPADRIDPMFRRLATRGIATAQH
jgi:AcrR family transcriptional regulator